VKIVDFGIAKAVGDDAQKVTKTGLVIGTPDYMSPEQLAGDPIDGRSDIYSLGLVAFNMLTGKLPFSSDSAQESLIMRLTDPPKTLAEARPEVSWPADLQSVLDKALARDVNARYQSAVDLGRDISRAAERMGSQVPAARRPATRAIVAPETRVASASRSKRPVFLYAGGGIAALLVVSAALYAPILHKDGKPASRPPDAIRNPPARSTDTVPPGVSAVSLDVDKELTQAETEARGDDQGAARRALRRLAALDGHLDGAGDAVRAALVRYGAYLTLKDVGSACAALKDVKDRARETSYQRKVDDRLAACP
jgi:serine/threonine-protein kinase